jgi:5-(carboxyamino)imidazole ribonucleotide mutase
MKKVAIVMGSKSDVELVKPCMEVLEEFGVPYDVKILSAHRTPDEVAKFAEEAERKYAVIIACAGYSAHLPGVIASKTTLPVLGVPLDTSPLSGFDSLLSIVQMPSGVPVATFTVGKAGSKNAGIFAVQILAVSNPVLRKKLKEFKERMRRKVISS